MKCMIKKAIYATFWVLYWTSVGNESPVLQKKVTKIQCLICTQKMLHKYAFCRFQKNFVQYIRQTVHEQRTQNASLWGWLSRVSVVQHIFTDSAVNDVASTEIDNNKIGFEKSISRIEELIIMTPQNPIIVIYTARPALRTNKYEK